MTLRCKKCYENIIKKDQGAGLSHTEPLKRFVVEGHQPPETKVGLSQPLVNNQPMCSTLIYHIFRYHTEYREQRGLSELTGI